jgi:microcompartment protein CcmK/EutM
MQLARVIGDVIVTRKDENLVGLKLLVVQPLTPEREPAGRPLVAADAVGAGIGGSVLRARGSQLPFTRQSRRSMPESSDRRSLDGRALTWNLRFQI